MSIQFIIGRSGYGKTHRCFEQIQRRLLENPQGPPLIYLVPEQMTFQSEKALLQFSDIGGMIRAQVYSFSRLAWKVLQETGGLARTHLTSVGTNMMLRKIIENHRSKLRALQRTADKHGFIEKTAEMIAEFKRYCIDPSAIFIDSATNQALRDKLHDLELIYTEFHRQLEGKYIDAEDYLALLAQKIPQSQYLADAEIWVDGFHSFTPNEYFVLEQLMKHARRVTFTCTMENVYAEAPNELDLFHENARNYRVLTQIASENGVPVEEPIVLRTPHRFRNQALLFLENHYDKHSQNTLENAEGIRLAAAANRRAEVDAVAREIIALVRDHKYHYRDISIMMRDISLYKELIETIFADYNIPFFLDEKRSMLHHPLIELIRSVFDIFTGNWNYEALFRAIKTDLFVPFADFHELDKMRHEFDRLENFALKLGLYRSRWKNDDVWMQFLKEKRMKEHAEKMFELRNLIHLPLLELEEKLLSAATVKEMATALYDFLIGLEIPEKLHVWITEAEEKGELAAAQEHEQVWKAVISFMDELVEIVGQETMPLDLFAKLVESGLESMKFSLVPPSLDQVLIGTVDRSRYTDVKCVFLIGVNEGVLPAKPVENGILSETDREALAKSGIVLAPGSVRQLLDEQFYIYLALTTPEDILYVSYPIADEEGKSLFPSPVIGKLKELFPSLKEDVWVLEPFEQENEFQYITTPEKSFSILTSAIRQWRRGYPLSDRWWHVYNWYVENERQHEIELLQRSLFYTNRANPLSKQTSIDLYGDVVQVSVSRMERFQACPFQQFASHGLRLKEREQFVFRAPDIGQLFHEALSLIAQNLRQRHIEWSALSEQQAFELADQAVQHVALNMQHQILFATHRNHYLTRKLKQVVGRAVSVLAKQARKSGFSPVGIELAFDKNAPLPPLTYELENGVKLEVVGRIDRVDRAISDDNEVYLRIIDYKSSSKDLRLADVYYGLQMQMLTYLDVVITHAPKWLGQEATPAGVLYFHIHNPIIPLKKAMSDDDIDDELFKQFKMKGFVLNDLKALTLMDKEIFEKNSDVLPVSFTKDGKLTKYSKAITKEEFDLVRNYIRDLTKTIGLKMTNGIVDISPYRKDRETPCGFCEFRSLCQFDASLAENEYRTLKVEKEGEILKKMFDERNADE